MTPPSKRFQAWRAADLANSNHWIFAAEASLAAADPASLRAWCQPLISELRHGSGVALLRGLGQLDGPALRQLYLAIGCCIGELDTTYGALYGVTDLGGSYREQAIPVSQTHASTTVHTDSSRLETHPRWVGLACVSQAPEGGGSGLASVVAVHDHLARHQPQALRRLHRCFHRDLVTPGGSRERQQRLANRFAVFQQAADGPSLRYMRHWIETGHALLGKPLAEADRQAFDKLDAALNDPRFRHPLRLEPGDLLFCDNHKTAHDREAYRDDPAAPRLMLRLWLNGGSFLSTATQRGHLFRLHAKNYQLVRL
jgi:alpha-ketoglutarate-dependent taurine dioxygenase